MTPLRFLGTVLVLLGTCLGSAQTQTQAQAQTQTQTETQAQTQTQTQTLRKAGESLYRQGIVADGAPVQAMRSDDGQVLQGEAAACVRCHRESGLGSHEGSYPMPPVSARYLYHRRARAPEPQAPPMLRAGFPERDAYTDATLARAIREGVDPEGRSLGYLMPRFQLGDADMAALIAYLKHLSPVQVRGVTPTVLHFATIFTPDADPVKRQAVLDVLDGFFAEKNRAPLSGATRRQSSGGPLSSGVLDAASRHWQLHIWDLKGSPSDWPAQLQQYLAREPVMAVVSGLGGAEWAPVHAFCQSTRLPCLFPNLEAPVDADLDFYSVYFSRGVLLEANLIAEALVGATLDSTAEPIQQVYRAGDTGAVGAGALARALQALGRPVEDVVIPAGAAGTGVREALRRAERRGPLVLWLRGEDLAALADIPPPRRPIYASGLLGGLERTPLPSAWRLHVALSYPFDLPEHRVARVDYARGWFRLRNIPVTAEPVQVDTYVACGLLSDALKQMADNLAPEYLVELIEEAAGHRALSGYYPRLSLGQGQRFASKGGYLVQLSDADDGRMHALGDWKVP